MSTFTMFNGPEQQCGAQATYQKLKEFHNALEAIDKKIATIETELKGLKEKDFETTGNITGAIGRFKELAAGNAALKGLSVDGKITAKEQEIQGKFTGKDIDVENIDAGSIINFNKHAVHGAICGHAYVLARTKKLEQGPHFVQKPAIVFASSPQDPRIQLLVEFTTKALSVVYTKKVAGDTTIFKDFTDNDGFVWPGLGLSLHEFDGFVYLVAHGFRSDGTMGATFLGSSQFYISCINCEPVTLSGIMPSLTTGNRLTMVPLKYDAGFAATNASFTDLSVTKFFVDDITAKDLKVTGSTSLQDVAIKKSLSVRENATFDKVFAQNIDVEQDAIVRGKTKLDAVATENLLVEKTITAETIQDKDGHTIINSVGDITTVGDNKEKLLLQAKHRPEISDGGIIQRLAYLSDLVNSILYLGKVTLYSETLQDIKEFFTNSSGTKMYHIKDGDTQLVISNKEATVAKLYVFSGTAWVLQKDIPADTNGRAYQWHADFVKEVQDAYFHEAEIVWAPSAVTDEKVSIINLPLEDYYNIEQIEKIKSVLLGLATTQTDWLNRQRVVVRDGIQYDNPAYLLNRPVTGISLLDGGNWDNGYPHPQFVVLGGNFDELETNTKHIIDADNEYQNCIIRVMYGQKASLPQAREETKNTLKWCEDTAELFLDCFELQDDASLQMHLNKGNFLLRSKKELQFVASLLWEPDNANASAVLNKLVSLRNTEFPVNEEATKTNTINYSGIRADNGQLYPFAFELKGSDRVRFKKTTRTDKHDNISDSNIDYYKRDNDIIVDIVVDDIIAYLKDNDKRITQIEDLDVRWKPDTSDASEIKDIAEYRGQKFEIAEDAAKTNKCKVSGTRIKNGTSIVEEFEYPITAGKRLRIDKTTGDDPEIIVDVVLDDLLKHADMLAKRTRAVEDLDVQYKAGTEDAVEIDDGLGNIAADSDKTNVCKVAGTHINNDSGEVEQFEYNIICDKRIRISKNDNSINISLVYSDIIDAIKANKAAIDNEKQERIAKDTELQAAIDAEKQSREVSIPNSSFTIFKTVANVLLSANVKAFRFGKTMQLYIVITKKPDTAVNQVVLEHIPLEFYPFSNNYQFDYDFDGVIYAGGLLVGNCSVVDNGGKLLVMGTVSINNNAAYNLAKSESKLYIKITYLVRD